MMSGGFVLVSFTTFGWLGADSGLNGGGRGLVGDNVTRVAGLALRGVAGASKTQKDDDTERQTRGGKGGRDDACDRTQACFITLMSLPAQRILKLCMYLYLKSSGPLICRKGSPGRSWKANIHHP